MKSFFLYFVLLFISNHDNKFSYYKQAMPIILNSKEFKEYKVGNYNVSSEIIPFSKFSFSFKDKLKNYENEIDTVTVYKSDSKLLSLNERKCGKMKIFFTEQKEGVFFAEVFLDRKKGLKYNDKSIFGSSKLYMFKIQDETVSLIEVAVLHNN